MTDESARMNDRRWTSYSIEGQRVDVQLRDGTHMDDCVLIARGRGSVDSLWLVADGEDRFLPLDEVTGVCPSRGDALVDASGGSRTGSAITRDSSALVYELLG